jgi:hypothetical protein
MNSDQFNHIVVILVTNPKSNNINSIVIILLTNSESLIR